jgi:hypothetical protein
MTLRKRGPAILNGQKPEGVPWFADLSYWARVLVERGEKPKDFIQRDQAFIERHRDLGTGFYFPRVMSFRTILENC